MTASADTPRDVEIDRVGLLGYAWSAHGILHNRATAARLLVPAGTPAIVAHGRALTRRAATRRARRALDRQCAAAQR